MTFDFIWLVYATPLSLLLWGHLRLRRRRESRSSVALEEAKAAGNAVTIIDVSEHRPRRIPSAKWRELIKKVWREPRCGNATHVGSRPIDMPPVFEGDEDRLSH